MMAYIFLFSSIIFCTIFDIIPLKQKKICTQVLLLMVCTYLILFAGLRYNIGLDYGSYEEIYKEVNGFFEILLFGDINFSNIHGEYGYLILNVIVKSIFNDFAFVVLFMSVLSIGLISYSCYKYSYFVFSSLFLYVMRFFFLRDMGQIRSAVACSIILYSIEAIDKQKTFKFFTLISIATLFHSAALIAVPIYFLNKYNFDNKIYYLLLGSSFILGIIIPFKEIFEIYLSEFDNAIVMYALSEQYGYELSVLNPVALMQMFFSLLFIIYRKTIIEKIKYYKPILNMYVFSTCWLLVFNKLGIIAGRISTMLTTVEILIIPAVLLGISSRKSFQILGYLMILTIGCMLIYMRIIVDDDFLKLLVPYNSII